MAFSQPGKRQWRSRRHSSRRWVSVGKRGRSPLVHGVAGLVIEGDHEHRVAGQAFTTSELIRPPRSSSPTKPEGRLGQERFESYVSNDDWGIAPSASTLIRLAMTPTPMEREGQESKTHALVVPELVLVVRDGFGHCLERALQLDIVGGGQRSDEHRGGVVAAKGGAFGTLCPRRTLLRGLGFSSSQLKQVSHGKSLRRLRPLGVGLGTRDVNDGADLVEAEIS